jgi:hypothetical protein
MNEDYTILKEENRLLKARIFDFRIQLELILEKPTEDLKLKEKLIKDIIQESVELTPYHKHDLTEYLNENYQLHPMLQLYDNFFGLNETKE